MKVKSPAAGGGRLAPVYDGELAGGAPSGAPSGDPRVETAGEVQSSDSPGKGPNFLDGCRHVYLDMGTNKGLQIRKLFQPQLFPKSGVHVIFDKYFGPYTHRFETTTAYNTHL